MFTTESALVQIWARNVRNGNYTREQVPNLSNLREMVYAALDEENEEQFVRGNRKAGQSNS